MRLYSASASPFARKVRALIIETGQSDEVEIVSSSGSPLDPGTIPTALNPLSKLPVLERPDGPALYDSRVICRYLDARAGGRLYPDPPRAWDMLTLEATADAIMEAALFIVYESRLRAGDRQSPDLIEAQWGKASRAIAHVNTVWMSHLAGRLDMSHLALACALGYLDFRLDERDWRGTAPDLAAWFEKIAERPSLAETRPS